MWASWTSSSSSTSSINTGGPSTTVAASSSAPPSTSSSSVAASLANMPSTAHPPQWRLLSTLVRRTSEQWSRVTAALSTRQTIGLAAAATAAVSAVLATAVVTRRARLTKSSRADVDGWAPGEKVQGTDEDLCSGAVPPQNGGAQKGKTVDGQDDIEFADPAESAFNAYVHRLKRQKESVLLSAIAQLESAAAELAATEQHLAESGQNTKDSDSVAADAGVVEQQAKVHRAAVVADELLTQYICSLDGVPVRQREDLKQRRKELVHGAGLLHKRIEPYLHPASTTTAL